MFREFTIYNLSSSLTILCNVPVDLVEAEIAKQKYRTDFNTKLIESLSILDHSDGVPRVQEEFDVARKATIKEGNIYNLSNPCRFGTDCCVGA